MAQESTRKSQGSISIKCKCKSLQNNYWQNYIHIYIKRTIIKSIDCSYRGPKLNSQHPHNGSERAVNSVPGDLTSEDIRYACGTQTYIHEKHTHT